MSVKHFELMYWMYSVREYLYRGLSSMDAVKGTQEWEFF